MKMRLVDTYVTDLSDDPDEQFHPDVAAEFEPVPADAPADLRAGYRFEEGVWTPPASAEPDLEPSDPDPAEPRYRTLMSPVRFKAQFSFEEQFKIKAARLYDPPAPVDLNDQRVKAKIGLDILFDSLADLVALQSEIDVADPAVIQGIDFCVAIGVLTTDRADTIKRGVEVSS